jgi:hypothetical protein
MAVALAKRRLITGAAIAQGGGGALDPNLPAISVLFAQGDSRTIGLIDVTGQGAASGRRWYNVWAPAAVTGAGGRIRFANDYKAYGSAKWQDILNGNIDLATTGGRAADGGNFDDTITRAQAAGAQAIVVMVGEADTIAWDQPNGARDVITQLAAKCYAAGMYLIIPTGAPIDTVSADTINRWLFQRSANSLRQPNGYTNVIVADTMPGFIVAGTGLDGDRTFQKLPNIFTDGRHHQPRGQQAWGRPIGKAILDSGRAADPSVILKPYVPGEVGTLNANSTFSLQTGTGIISGPFFAPGGGALPVGAGGKPDAMSLSLTASGTLACDLDYTTLDGMNALRLHVYGRPAGAVNALLGIAIAAINAVPNPSKLTTRARMKVLPGAQGLLGAQVTATGNGTAGASYVQDARYRGARPAFAYFAAGGPSGRASSWLEDGFDGWVVTPPVDVNTTKGGAINLLIDGASITQDNFGAGYDPIPPAVDFTVILTALTARAE